MLSILEGLTLVLSQVSSVQHGTPPAAEPQKPLAVPQPRQIWVKQQASTAGGAASCRPTKASITNASLINLEASRLEAAVMRSPEAYEQCAWLNAGCYMRFGPSHPLHGVEHTRGFKE
ncbi:hypothetical protein LshimejAT787_0202060 [Lyophyllum shimeji]|uniref:Uncharacterized protein n=1 Tax=Lyophyllum shimeji TaxID=47721 RepID=A0A9P3PEZ9_LYOSH|nr:hypothetical protein LshimejAT787_0202060 [Lyophyllum shimeji]